MVAERRLSWRRSALDLPLALLIALVLLQLALGNRPLAAWALAPSASPTPRPPYPRSFSPSVRSPRPTPFSALLLFLTYAVAYVLVLHLIRTRPQLDRLVTRS